MKITHLAGKKLGDTGTLKILADDYPSITILKDGDVLLRVKGGKYLDLKYDVILTKGDVDKINERLVQGNPQVKIYSEPLKIKFALDDYVDVANKDK